MKILTKGWDKIPFADRMQIDRYFEGAVEPSKFLLHVLKNDLKNAVYAATEDEVLLLPTYIDYVHSNAPKGSCGSVTAVKNWLKGYY